MRKILHPFLFATFLILSVSAATGFSQDAFNIKSIHYQGNKTFSSLILNRTVQARGSSILNKILFWKKSPQYYNNAIQEDVQRLLRFYQTEGFVNARVTVDKKWDSDKAVEITFIIEENTPIRVSATDFIIKTNVPSDSAAALANEAAATLHLHSGNRFRDVLYNQDRETIINFFTNKGFPYNRLKANFDIKKDSVQVQYIVTTGLKCVFGEYSITGLIKAPKRKTEKQVAFKPGDQFNQGILQKTQRQIYGLGVFQYVSVNSILDSSYNNIVPIEIRVKESPRFSVKTGIGYGKEEKVRLSAEILKIGFLGGVKRINLVARHSYLEPYNFSLKWVHPAAFSPSAAMTIEPFIRKEREPGYSIRRVGGNLSYQYNISDHSNGFLNYSLEQDNLYTSQQTLEEILQNSKITLYNKSSVTLALTRDTSEPIFTPEKGIFTAATFTFSGAGFQSDYHFYRILIESRYYHKIFNKFVLAAKIKSGIIESWETGEVTPIEDRFYAGGSNSIRGWTRSDIGPKNTTGVPVGGNSYFESSLEFRYPIWKRLSGSIFTDAGNVWTKTMGYQLSSFHYAAGAGLLFGTPIGPVRCDIARPIFESRTRIQIHISAGYAF